jgi:hypothetical protein
MTFSGLQRRKKSAIGTLVTCTVDERIFSLAKPLI